MIEPRSQMGQRLKAEALALAWKRAWQWWAILSVAAVLAAWWWQSSGSMSLVPPPTADDPAPLPDAEGLEFALHLSAYSAWVALALLIPAYAAFFFRTRHGPAWRTWLTFWTVSCVAYLLHIGWSGLAFFGGDLAAMQTSSRISAFWPAVAIALWWPLDCWLAVRRAEESRVVRYQRIALHGAVLALFLGGSAWKGETLPVKVLGFALGGAVLAAAYDAWKKRPRA